LPISHDEVVHGKRSLPDEGARSDWRGQRLATLTRALAFMWAFPASRVILHGPEIADTTTNGTGGGRASMRGS